MGILERLVADGVTRRKFTGEEVLAMCEAGILGDPCHVEVIEGEMLEMAPEGDEHQDARHVLARALVPIEQVEATAQARLAVFETPTVWLPDGGFIEPDVAVVKEYQRKGRIFINSVLLAIEISKSSIRYDLGMKRTLYANASLLEYWIVDLNAREILVHTSPVNGRYERIERFSGHQTIVSPTLADISLRVDSVL
jgi:Uma2 family endonuclease